jgi:Wzt-like putative exopolysaccharide export protein
VAAKFTSGNAVTGGHATTGGPLRVTMRIAAAADLSVPSLGVTIRSQTGVRLVNADIITEGTTVPLRAGCNELELEIDALYLSRGLYLVDLWLGDAVGTAIDWRESAFYLEVLPGVAETLGTTARIDALVPCTFRVTPPALLGASAS